jgi:hypothetical protein
VLDANKITNVDDVPWPPSLTHISLSDNLLTSVAGVCWPPHLRCLLLHSNAIQFASSSTAAAAAPAAPAAAAVSAAAPQRHRARVPAVSLWPLHLTALDLGRNQLSAAACVGLASQPPCSRFETDFL